ncbi:MAG: DNA polymerase III subunit gamma/tau [Bacteroidota bacterium]|nr:DNA polymerase III subunit gamma/tau [Bacteroidota bacterium]
MSQYLVSARKYRPTDFTNVVGQAHVTKTLENAIINNQISHAYIFCGPRGVGKTSCARIFAKRINNISEENKEDGAFNIFELDAASNNSVDDIRELVNQTRIPPQKGKYKVYIIDEVHMLSKSAFNAFLKTLEEPPKYCVFILATTEKQKLIPTILSRCQIFEFNRISLNDIVIHLSSIVKKENIKVDERSIQLIADSSDGALRDALSTFDKIISFCGKEWKHEEVEKILNSLNANKTISFIEMILNQDIFNTLIEFDNLLEQGFEGKDLIISLTEYFRNIMLCKNPKSIEIIKCEGELKTKLEDLSKKIPTENILLYLDTLNDCQKQYSNSFNQRFLVELCLMQLCSQNGFEKKKKIIIAPPDSFNLKSRNFESKEQKKNILNEETEVHNDNDENNKEENLNEESKVHNNNDKNIKDDDLTQKSILGTTINDCLNDYNIDKNEIKETYNNVEQLVNISQESLLPIWKNLLTKLKKEGKPNLHATMYKQRQNKIENNILELNVNSEVQKKEILDNQNMIIDYLKTYTKINFLKIDVKINELIEEKVLYTNEDKLQYILKENPTVFELIKNLDLEIKE